MKKVLLFFALFMLTHTVNAELTISKNGNNIVTITQTEEGEIGYALQNRTLSEDDLNDIMSAEGFVLEGPFRNDPDLMQLSQKNQTIVLLDMDDCVISSNNLMVPTIWKNTLELIELPTCEEFNKLPSNFLYGFQKVRQIVIPPNVKTIESGALGNMTLEEITIPATLERIKEGAFKETVVLKDVYVESRNTICDMNAFDFETLVGQTDVASLYKYAAKLHYPDTPEDYEYFVGSWKEGRTLRQDQLNGFKDGLWEWIPGMGIVKVGPNNGWQQFALSDNSEPIPMVNKTMRTYSDFIEHDDMPTGNQYEIRVYRGTGYNKNGNVMLQRIRGRYNIYNCVPANTGVLLYIITPQGQNYIHYFANTHHNVTTYPHHWSGKNESNTSGSNNLFEKSVTPTEVHPVWPWPRTTVEYRNFGLFLINGTYRWARLTSSTLGANKAYLKMPASVFTNNNEGEEEGPGNQLAKAFNMGTITTSQGEDDGPDYVGFEFPEDDDMYADNSQSDMRFLFADPNDVIIPNQGITTNISELIVKQDDNYYTLQGIKTKNPSKGVYIKNGKKVIVK